MALEEFTETEFEAMEREIRRVTGESQIIAFICYQFGDSGKGKLANLFSLFWADVIARGTGGPNAGHTFYINGEEIICHLVPCGIAYDHLGKKNIMGNGMAVDVSALVKELAELNEAGISHNNLILSKEAHIIMPYHIARDKAKNQSQKSGGIGSTGRGMGPCYEDKIARRGIMVGDLFNQDTLVKKIRAAILSYAEQTINEDEIVADIMARAQGIRDLVGDTRREMHQVIKQGKRILLEGAQGNLLSIEHGTYPYVTSSDCSINGTASGVGISATDVDQVYGVAKFPFMTRVGGGPFPTELGGEKSEEYCGDDAHRKEYELETYGIPYEKERGKIKYNSRHLKILEMINSPDPFMQGIGIRLAAGEYGATTGRPRRTGWTDAVAVKTSVRINGKRSRLVLTKADCLSGAKNFSLCFGHDYSGSVTDFFERDKNVLKNAKPVYEEYKGYDLTGEEREYDELPPSLRQSISALETFTEAPVAVVSLSPGKKGTIIR